MPSEAGCAPGSTARRNNARRTTSLPTPNCNTSGKRDVNAPAITRIPVATSASTRVCAEGRRGIRGNHSCRRTTGPVSVSRRTGVGRLQIRNQQSSQRFSTGYRRSCRKEGCSYAVQPPLRHGQEWPQRRTPHRGVCPTPYYPRHRTGVNLRRCTENDRAHQSRPATTWFANPSVRNFGIQLVSFVSGCSQTRSLFCL